MNIDYLIKIADEYEEVVVALKDPMIIETAMKLSYYMSMVDAADHDPLDDPEEQEAILSVYQERIQEAINQFQTLVNDQL